MIFEVFLDKPAVISVLSAGITGTVMLLGQWITRRGEDRRHRRELAISTAFKCWSLDRAAALQCVRNGGESQAVAAIDLYIFHLVRLMDSVVDKHLSSDELTRVLANIRETVGAAHEAHLKSDNRDG